MRMLRWDGNTATETTDELACEEPLELRVRGRGLAVTMRTPGHDPELAAGFLLSEGVIRSSRDLLRIEHCDRNDAGNVLNVVLAPEVQVDFERLTRHVFASSSCGLCGKATIESVSACFRPVESDCVIRADILAAMPDTMRAAQSGFDRTGGLHAAAIFDLDGRFVVLREDVGRHNAVDKALGHCLLNGPFPLDRHVLLVSGRGSFEIMQKSLAARLPMVAAISAPSSLAVEFAETSGQTLVGFLRTGRMNVYTHSHRINFAARASYTVPVTVQCFE